MVPDSFKDERYRIDGSVRQLWFSSNRADYHWSVVQSSPWTFRSINRRLFIPSCQWSSGPFYHLSVCPPFSGTNSRRWRNCTNDQSQSKWIIGLSLCLSSGLLLYWTKRGLFHEIMVSAIPQIKIQLHFPKWVPMLFPIKVKVSHYTRVTSWRFCTMVSLFRRTKVPLLHISKVLALPR